MSKTNYQHLQNCTTLKEALEFAEAMNNEIEGLTDALKASDIECRDHENRIDELEKEVDDLNEDDNDDLIEINCGYGSIFYKEPDNLKLQIAMETFKERMQVTAH